MRAKQSPNESAQSRCIEQNAFKTFRRRRHEIDVVVVASAKAQTCAHLRIDVVVASAKAQTCAHLRIDVVVASAKAQTCAHLRTLGRALATQ